MSYEQTESRILKTGGYGVERNARLPNSHDGYSGYVETPHGFVRVMTIAWGTPKYLTLARFIHNGVEYERRWSKKFTRLGLIRAGAKLARDVVEGEG